MEELLGAWSTGERIRAVERVLAACGLVRLPEAAIHVSGESVTVQCSGNASAAATRLCAYYAQMKPEAHEFRDGEIELAFKPDGTRGVSLVPHGAELELEFFQIGTAGESDH